MNPARVLVVDDNTADVNLLRMALNQQRKDYVLEVLRTGDEAIRYVQQHKDGTRPPEPCVILIDLHLPKYDGLAILNAIRQASVLTHIHVVVLSSSASPQEKRRIDSMDAVYREKPFSVDDYIELGAEILAICEGKAVIAA